MPCEFNDTITAEVAPYRKAEGIPPFRRGPGVGLREMREIAIPPVAYADRSHCPPRNRSRSPRTRRNPVRRHAGVDANSVDPDRGVGDSIHLNASDYGRRLALTNRERLAGRRVEYRDAAVLPRCRMSVDDSRDRTVVRDRRGLDRERNPFVRGSVPEDSVPDDVATIIERPHGLDCVSREIHQGVGGDQFWRDGRRTGPGVPTSAPWRDHCCRRWRPPSSRGPVVTRSTAR